MKISIPLLASKIDIHRSICLEKNHTNAAFYGAFVWFIFTMPFQILTDTLELALTRATNSFSLSAACLWTFWKFVSDVVNSATKRSFCIFLWRCRKEWERVLESNPEDQQHLTQLFYLAFLFCYSIIHSPRTRTSWSTSGNISYVQTLYIYLLYLLQDFSLQIFILLKSGSWFLVTISQQYFSRSTKPYILMKVVNSAEWIRSQLRETVHPTILPWWVCVTCSQSWKDRRQLFRKHFLTTYLIMAQGKGLEIIFCFIESQDIPEQLNIALCSVK